MKNNLMLITYADSLGNDLYELKELLDNDLKDAFGALHILPFYPSSGDRGFAPISYYEVDKKFGSFEILKQLSKEYFLMYDFMVNHISRESVYFQDFLKNGEKSKYKNLFITYSEFFNNSNPSKKEIDLIYKRKPEEPFLEIKFNNQSFEKVWSTFSDEQIDINVDSVIGKKFIKENLEFLIENGAKIIRLDAFAYACKKRKTNCFFVQPDTSNLLDFCNQIVKEKNVLLLPEIHEHYSIHKNIESMGYYTYDFALPMIMLYTIYSKTYSRLLNWLNICPKDQFTTLDTHDGIGVVDVVDLLSTQEIDFTKDYLYKNGANVKQIYSSKTYGNLDIYQINCTFYSALGNDDKQYLLSRAIQMYVPGIPQIYYVGALSGENDIKLLEATKEGRNINRHYYSKKEVKEQLKRDINIKLLKLFRYRNNNNIFNGQIKIKQISEYEFSIKYMLDIKYSEIYINLKNYSFEITENDVTIMSS